MYYSIVRLSCQYVKSTVIPLHYIEEKLQLQCTATLNRMNCIHVYSFPLIIWRGAYAVVPNIHILIYKRGRVCQQFMNESATKDALDFQNWISTLNFWVLWTSTAFNSIIKYKSIKTFSMVLIEISQRVLVNDKHWGVWWGCRLLAYWSKVCYRNTIKLLGRHFLGI